MNKKECENWIQRAESNLRLAKKGNVEGVVYEDLCFEAQQAAEKALKALLIYFGDEFPRVHSFTVLLERLQKYIVLPPNVEDVIELSDYAIQTRYPGDYYPVAEKEYRRAIIISQEVLKWVKQVTKRKK